jgi:hypothetical protein
LPTLPFPRERQTPHPRDKQKIRQPRASVRRTARLFHIAIKTSNLGATRVFWLAVIDLREIAGRISAFVVLALLLASSH